ASGWRCMSAGFCSAISAVATGSTSPVSVPPSILPPGWKRSPDASSASWSPRSSLPGSAAAAGPISASFRSPDSPGPSGSTAWPTKPPSTEVGRLCLQSFTTTELVDYSSGSVVNNSGYPLARPASVARVALVSATSLVKTETTQTPRRCAVILGHPELGHQDPDDEFPRGIVVVDEDDLVQARSFGLCPHLGPRFGDGIDHSAALPGGLLRFPRLRQTEYRLAGGYGTGRFAGWRVDAAPRLLPNHGRRRLTRM